MRPIWRCVFVFLGLILSGVAQSAPSRAPVAPSVNRARDLFDSTSAQLLKDMDREEARTGYRQVVQIDDHYAAAWFNLGVLAEAAGDWTEAKGDFQKYLSIAPLGPYAVRAQRELKVIDQRSIQPAPTKDQKYNAAIDRARALLSAKFYKESIAEAAVAQALDDSRWEAYAVVSLCLARQKKRDEAKKFQGLAVDHAPASQRKQIQEELANEITERIR